MSDKKSYQKLLKDVSAIARELSVVQKQAEKLGISSGLRDLIECKKCGLVEDVLFDGRLVTYYESGQVKDTGLRFKHKGGGIYFCPKCGFKIETLDGTR